MFEDLLLPTDGSLQAGVVTAAPQPMFKHLLLPTDGSALSEAAVCQGVALAKTLGARVTGLHVSPEFHVITHRSELLENTANQYLEDSQRHAAEVLAQVQREAQASGVACETVAVASDHPHEAIIRTAEERGCDLIAMASHGRKGIKGFLLGSETHKVLTLCDKPVLVFRSWRVQLEGSARDPELI